MRKLPHRHLTNTDALQKGGRCDSFLPSGLKAVADQRVGSGQEDAGQM